MDLWFGLHIMLRNICFEQGNSNKQQTMRYLLTHVLFFTSFFTFSQTKTFTVDVNSIIGAGGKMTGVNTGPHSIVSGTTEECLQTIGTELVRTHDYHGPCDYFGYSKFYDVFNSTFNYTFQSHVDTCYNWTSTDTQINEIVNANLTPFFRLGISFPGQGNPPLTPMPKDQDGINFHQFAGICKRTAMHYTDGWNAGYTYSIPYWEIWNEPNNNASWDIDSVSAYYRMYQQSVDSIKSFNPELKVGGPGTAKNAFFTGGIHYTLNQNYISNFLQFCQTNTVPLDFYSFHMYDKKNPYHIKILADTLSYYLNQYGFDSTELVLSETNINTDGYDNTSKGCSYLASELIAVKDTRISKFIWYRGVDLNPLCNADNGSSANLTLNGYAYQFFNELNDSTPNLLSSTGNEFDADNIMDSLNNVMILSGKNSSDDLVKILVANHESVYTDLNVIINNLSWTSSDQINITIEKVTDSGYATSNSVMSGSTTMTVNLPAVSDASTFFITLRNASANGISNLSMIQNVAFYPNPANSTIDIETDISEYEISLANTQGQILFQQLNTEQINVNNFPEGLYFIALTSKSGETITRKMMIRK